MCSFILVCDSLAFIYAFKLGPLWISNSLCVSAVKMFLFFRFLRLSNKLRIDQIDSEIMAIYWNSFLFSSLFANFNHVNYEWHFHVNQQTKHNIWLFALGSRELSPLSQLYKVREQTTEEIKINGEKTAKKWNWRNKSERERGTLLTCNQYTRKQRKIIQPIVEVNVAIVLLHNRNRKNDVEKRKIDDENSN